MAYGNPRRFLDACICSCQPWQVPACTVHLSLACFMLLSASSITTSSSAPFLASPVPAVRRFGYTSLRELRREICVKRNMYSMDTTMSALSIITHFVFVTTRTATTSRHVLDCATGPAGRYNDPFCVYHWRHDARPRGDFARCGWSAIASTAIVCKHGRSGPVQILSMARAVAAYILG
jgi:hypothetical protein